MKIILATIIFHLFLFSTNSYFVAALPKGPPVLDTDGDKVISNVEYYILSIFRGAGGGGLDLDSTEDKPCPKFVVQAALENGRPVSFYPVDTSDQVIYQFADTNIEFSPGLDAYCRSSTLWKLEDYDSSSGRWWITTDGEKGNSTSWFKIRKSGSYGYTLGYCPTACESCASLCNYIKTFPYENQTRLGLNKEGVGSAWVFVKASKSKKQVAEKQSK